MFDKENFCVQPWIHLASWNDGSVPLCCVASPEQGINLNNSSPIEVWNSEQFKKARLSFLENKKIPQCSHCWKEEHAGMKSHRIIENNIWQRYLGKEFLENLINDTNDDGSVNHYPITLDLRLGNTCNLQCVMCRPRDSSKWLQDAKRLSIMLENPQARGDWAYKANSIASTDCFDWFEKQETQDSLNEFMKDIRHIIFGGGEPLLIKDHEKLITNLVESGYSKNISLRYHTNGTSLQDKFLELWSQFQEVEVMISLDDWGDRNDYVRYPADFSGIYKNLQKLDSTPDNIVVNILTTVHAMNVYNLPEFALNIINSNFKKICKRNDGLFSIGTTHWPQYMSVQVLPKSVKDKIVEHWNSFSELQNNKRWVTRIQPHLDFMNMSDDSNRFVSLLDYIDKLDELRPIQFKNVYSEYFNLLKG